MDSAFVSSQASLQNYFFLYQQHCRAQPTWTTSLTTNDRFAEALSKKLLAAGYVHIMEKDEWKLEKGGKCVSPGFHLCGRVFLVCTFPAVYPKGICPTCTITGPPNCPLVFRYFFTRNQSSIVAFAVGKKYQPGNGVYMVGAHTDSPCLKVKPVSKTAKSGYGMVNIATYGGGLWTTWFDRDLSVAGRVLVRNEDGKLAHRLVRSHSNAGIMATLSENSVSKLAARVAVGWMVLLSNMLMMQVKIEKPILRVPMLAIHLMRNIRETGFNPNPQNELIPLLTSTAKAQLEAGPGASAGPSTESPAGAEARHSPVLLKYLADELGCSPESIVDLELNICDVQPGQFWGMDDEFLAVGRLDNLSMSWCSMQVSSVHLITDILNVLCGTQLICFRMSSACPYSCMSAQQQLICVSGRHDVPSI